MSQSRTQPHPVRPALDGRAGGLYAICDADSCARAGLDLVDTAVAMLDARVPLLQLRLKNRDAQEMVDSVGRVLSSGAHSGSLVFVNDRADVAELCGADGVHVGQEDLAPSDVRTAFPRLLVGLSTHDSEQFHAAQSLGLDYVALGPIFRTVSKRNPEPEVGLARLSQCATQARAFGTPLVAIGGIDEPSLGRVAPHCDFVAAIAGLLPLKGSSTPYSDIRAQCETWQRAIEASRSERAGG